MSIQFDMKLARRARPLPRQDHSAVVHDDGMFVFGGRGPADEPLGDTHRFDLTDRKWSKVKTRGKAPPARYGHSAVVYDGQMFVYGGVVAGRWPTAGHDPHFHVLDLQTAEWSRFQPAGQGPAVAYHAVALYGPLLFVYGGLSSPGTFRDGLSAINLETRKWLALECGAKRSHPGAVARCGLAVVDKVLHRFLGQESGGGFSRTLETIDLRKVVPETTLYELGGTEPQRDGLALRWRKRGRFKAAEGSARDPARAVYGYGRSGTELVAVGGTAPDARGRALLASVTRLSLPGTTTRPPGHSTSSVAGLGALSGHTTVQTANRLVVFGGAATAADPENNNRASLSNDVHEIVLSPPRDARTRRPRRVKPFFSKPEVSLPPDLPVATVLLVDSEKWEPPASYFQARIGRSNYLNWLEADFPDIRAYLKRGDVVENVRWSGDRSYGIQMYDGKTLVPVYKGYDDYGTLSAEFKMFREFHPRYWDELLVDDRFAPGKKSRFYWHATDVCQLIDEDALAAGRRVRSSERGPYVLVRYQGLDYAVLKSCPTTKEGRIGVVYRDQALAKSLGVDAVVGPE